MRRREGSSRLWPVAKATWHHHWGVWLVGEQRYSKDLKELLDVFDI
jgi:hypothetical protein